MSSGTGQEKARASVLCPDAARPAARSNQLEQLAEGNNTAGPTTARPSPSTVGNHARVGVFTTVDAPGEVKAPGRHSAPRTQAASSWFSEAKLFRHPSPGFKPWIRGWSSGRAGHRRDVLLIFANLPPSPAIGPELVPRPLWAIRVNHPGELASRSGPFGGHPRPRSATLALPYVLIESACPAAAACFNCRGCRSTTRTSAIKPAETWLETFRSTGRTKGLEGLACVRATGQFYPLALVARATGARAPRGGLRFPGRRPGPVFFRRGRPPKWTALPGSAARNGACPDYERHRGDRPARI